MESKIVCNKDNLNEVCIVTCKLFNSYGFHGKKRERENSYEEK